MQRRAAAQQRGVDRVTVWLADVFRKVTGADISAEHLDVVEEAIAHSGRTNIELCLLDSKRLCSRYQPARPSTA